MKKILKVGDSVFIKKGLESKEYNGCNFVPCMSPYCGRQAKIKKIRYIGATAEGMRYGINLDNESWSWSIDMFETEEIVKEVFGIVNFCKKYY